MPKLFTRPFAETGDKSLPPDNDNSGFVSFTQGYTPDYERSLAKGDPLAKAVERPIQNGLFNQITDHLLWYQTHGFMQWDATRAANAGYSFNDIVVDTVQTVEPFTWRVFRAAKDNVMSKPTSASASSASPDWEEIPLPSVVRSLIPFQSGKDFANLRNAATSFITGGTIESLSKGFYICPNVTSVTTITDLPPKIGESTIIKPFTVEVAEWETTEGTTPTVYRIERMVTVDGFVFVRSKVNGNKGNWVPQVTPQMQARGYLNMADATVSGNGAALVPKVPFVATVGSHLNFVAPGASSGAADYQVNIGGNNYNVVGRNMARLANNAIQADTWVEMVLINPTTFMLLSANSGQFQVPTAVADDAAPTWKQVKDLFATALNFDKIFPVGFAFGFMNGTDPNTAYPGTKWRKLPQGTSWRNAAAGQNPGDLIGSDTFKLALANIPAHDHKFSTTTGQSGAATLTTSPYDYGSKPTNSTGNHSHRFSGSTSSNGQHSHGASTNTTGSHAHAYAGDDELPPVWGYQARETDRYDADSDKNRWSNRYWTSTSGAHSHTVTIVANGAHQHTFSGTTSSDGEHAHSVEIGSHGHSVQTPNHTHSVNGTTDKTGNADATPIDTVPKSIILIGWYRYE
ncbi:tail fiber protein [Pantoea phage Kyle]|uniref:Tail fiber protein n=1 Tax=Pantoea phage Kyle TaxID=2589665 RepID=A0A514A8U6_9CAUD|nr:tail protein [Pantoea phage Kyle]QDH49675.1 tail fiber protein [Pantoea phage Kyle]